MTLVWFDEPEGKNIVLEILNYVFSAIFTIEAIIKLIAFKKAYFFVLTVTCELLLSLCLTGVRFYCYGGIAS